MPGKTPVITEEDITTSNGDDDEFIVDEELESEGTVNTVDFDQISFDDAQVETERRRLIAPSGDWLKQQVWSFSADKNVKVDTEDRVPGDINPLGRTSFFFYGYPETRTSKEGHDFTPFLRFQFSPDKREDKKKENQVDYKYKMFIFARDAYISTCERKPKLGELLRFLAEEEYIINTFNGDDGPIVSKIKAKRENK